jgi:hypothetical protein
VRFGGVAFVLVLTACQAAPQAGAVCTRPSDCASPLTCAFGHCRNACASNRDCGVGASCLLDANGDGSCGLDVDLGCMTGVGRSCPTGLVCVGDRCLQRCSASMGCATGSVCTPIDTATSFCSASGTDAGTTDTAATDACSSLIDLTMLDAGGGPVDYRGDTTMTPVDGRFVFPCLSTTERVAHQIAFRYRMRTDGFLLVDTATSSTLANFDTVAGIFASCTLGPTSIACNDDTAYGDVRARVVTPSPLPAGTDVVLAVGGLDPTGPTYLEAGPLDVRVSELAAAAVGTACDPTGSASRCIDSGCATVRSGQGSCVAPVNESEPNARPSGELLASAMPAFVTGTVGASGDSEDCYAIDVSAGGSLVAVVSDGAGNCPAGPEPVTLTLYDPTGTMITQAVGVRPSPACPPVDGTTMGAAHALSAGRYVVCLTQPEGSMLAYQLSISVLP